MGGGSTTATGGGSTTATGGGSATATGGGTTSVGGAGEMPTGGGNPTASKVPIFIAQGGAGRTIISCDDGHTWVDNHSWDIDADPLMCSEAQTAQCYQTNCSYEVNNTCTMRQCCNDTPDVPKGVAFGNGVIVATWGWGTPGAVRVSTDAIHWTTTHPNDTFGGVAFGSDRFVVASRSPFLSPDGTTWTATQTANFLNTDGTPMWSVRRFAFLPYDTGRFLAVASGNTNRDVLLSSDNGETWHRPTTLPDACANIGSEYGGITYGNGIAVIVDPQGNACRSADGGDTWTFSVTGATQVISHGVFTGTEFWYWGDDKDLLKSTDGMTWTKTPMATPMRIGPVERSPQGTLVAVDGFWQVSGGGQQHFLRSTDGLTWEVLPASAFTQSHDIFYMAYGLADPSPNCPLP